MRGDKTPTGAGKLERKPWLEIARGKILDDVSLSRHLAIWKFFKKKIVFTNGCFDILHAGHVSLLAQARDLGDVLIVGVNSDESVRRLKGEGRPVNNIEHRTLMLAGLLFVDAVVVFDEDTPENLIKKIKPDVLVKGSDYEESQIVGADFVKSYGGEVIRIPLVDNLSTSKLIEKIRQI